MNAVGHFTRMRYTLGDNTFNSIAQGIAYEKAKMFDPELITAVMYSKIPRAAYQLSLFQVRNVDEETWKNAYKEHLYTHLYAQHTESPDRITAVLCAEFEDVDMKFVQEMIRESFS